MAVSHADAALISLWICTHAFVHSTRAKILHFLCLLDRFNEALSTTKNGSNTMPTGLCGVIILSEKTFFFIKVDLLRLHCNEDNTRRLHRNHQFFFFFSFFQRSKSGLNIAVVFNICTLTGRQGDKN